MDLLLPSPISKDIAYAATDAAPIAHTSPLLELDAPPKQVAGAIILAALLVGTSEGEPSVRRVPTRPEPGQAGEQCEGAVPCRNAIHEREGTRFVGRREHVCLVTAGGAARPSGIRRVGFPLEFC